MSDHLARSHAGSSRLTDAQLGSIGYVRCAACHGCFRRTTTGKTRRHACAPSSTPLLDPAGAATSAGTDGSMTVDGRTWTEAYLDLARLPTTRGLLPPHVVTEWVLLCERLATSYLANPTSEEALFHLLAAPKLALSPWRDESLSLLKSITSYPSVPPITPQPLPDRQQPAPALSRQVRRLLRRGQLRRAAAELSGKSNILPVNDEVLRQLREKFPSRTQPAFGLDGSAPRSCDFDDLDSSIKKCFRQFPADISGGISSWTQPLLGLALRTEKFRQFVGTLTRQLTAGTAPGNEMFGASLLTPLAKPGGGVRPIACLDLIYRLCAKVILSVAPLAGALHPCQLGIGSPGGVEPIILFTQLVAEGKVPSITHVTSIDFANAYGSVFRHAMDRAVRKYAPALYRLTKQRYEPGGTMVLLADGRLERITAEEGCYQGDPLAGLLFCLTVRMVLEQLIEYLRARGFNAHVLTYLDDWTIFCDRAGALAVVQEFFTELQAHNDHCGLQLNPGKSWEISREDLLTSGRELLGTIIGGPTARSAFLLRKSSELEAVLPLLDLLEKQDALLLLRGSLQHRLRHLQRFLPTADIDDSWFPVDTALHHSLRVIRDGPTSPRRGPYDAALFQLPLRRGGLAVPRHSLVAPHARAAMEQSAGRFLHEILPPALCSAIPGAEDLDSPVPSQRARVQHV